MPDVPRPCEGQPSVADLRRRLARIDASVYRSWVRFVSCGGSLGQLEFEACLHEALGLDRSERIVLEQTVWEAENLRD